MIRIICQNSKVQNISEPVRIEKLIEKPKSLKLEAEKILAHVTLLSKARRADQLIETDKEHDEKYNFSKKLRKLYK
jgi:hypothetical protein